MTFIDEQEFERFSDSERLAKLNQFAAENRRLRQILDGVSRATNTKGAIVELFGAIDPGGRDAIGILVCRPDVDEAAFIETLKESLAALLGAGSADVTYGPTRVTGIEEERGPQ